jgi:hypothetical protein
MIINNLNYHNQMKNYIFLIIMTFVINISYAQDSTKSKSSIKYQANFNTIFNKNIVENLVLISTNRLVIENKWTRFEPTLNYRLGFVKPNGRPTINLENDLFIQLENNFLPKNKFFPAIIAGYENSPNLRQLENRYIYGLGFGNYIFKKPNNFLQLNVYASYENSDFRNIDYDIFRVYHTFQGRVFSKNHKMGVLYSANYAQSPSDFDKFRVKAFIKPYIKLSNKIDLNFMYDFWYESIVDGESPKEITNVTIGISISNF